MQFSNEINLGQMLVVISIMASGVGIYLKARLDVQRLTINHTTLVRDTMDMRTKLDAVLHSLQDMRTDIAVLKTTSNFSNDLAQAMTGAVKSVTNYERAARRNAEKQS